MTARRGDRRPRIRRRHLLRLTAPIVFGGFAIGATACSAPRDPLADLDPAAWPVRSGDDLEASAATMEGPARERAQDLARHVAAARLTPRALAGLDADATAEHLRDAAAPLWADPFEQALRSASRPHVATQFAGGIEPVGEPWAQPQWRLDEGRVHLDCTVAHTVFDAATEATGVVALTLKLSALMDAANPAAGMESAAVLHGVDLCAMRTSDGMIVPALEPARQREVLRWLQDASADGPAALETAGDGIGNRSC